jgi:hypothetical protein
VLASSCAETSITGDAPMLTPDHIVIVIEENHDKDQIVGN